MKIEVNYNPSNTACPTLGHFEDNWIHSETIHPLLKVLDYVLIKSDEDMIYLLNDDNDIIEEFEPLRLDELSNYILNVL